MRRCLVLLFCLGIIPTFADKLKIEQMIPSPVLGYLTIDDLTLLKLESQKHPLLKVIHEPWCQKMIEQLLARFRIEVYNRIQPLFGQLELTEVLELLEGQVAIVLHSVEWDSSRELELSDFVISVVVEFGPSNQARVKEMLGKIIDFIRGNLKESGEDLVENPYSLYGADFNELTIVKADGTPWKEKIYFGMDQSHLVIGIQNKNEVEILFQMLGGNSRSDTFAQTNQGRELFQVHGPTSFLRGYFDLQEMFKLIENASPENAGSLAMFLPILGLNALDNLSFSFRLNRDLLEHQFFFSCPAPRQGLMKMIETKTGELTPQKFVGEQVQEYITFYYDLLEIYDEILQTISRADPNVLTELEAGLAQIKQITQLDLRQDILASFGNRFTSIIYEMNSDKKEDVLPEMILLWDLANEQKFTRAKDAVLKLLELESSVSKQDYLWKPVWTIPNILGEFSPAFTIGGGHFCLSFTETALKRYLREQAQPGKSLANTPAYQSLSSHPLSQAGSLMFSNVQASILEDPDYQASLIKSGIDPSQLPTKDQLAPYQFHSISYYRSDNKGFLFQSILSAKQ